MGDSAMWFSILHKRCTRVGEGVHSCRPGFFDLGGVSGRGGPLFGVSGVFTDASEIGVLKGDIAAPQKGSTGGSNEDHTMVYK